ncbi:hypothetical protein EDC01DRAFT_448017 [Geopyxis carbonaria]|nr:hypothetical protein EDC01DRAFT_448017 [Geopyxis carbonaria]
MTVAGRRLLISILELFVNVASQSVFPTVRSETDRTAVFSCGPTRSKLLLDGSPIGQRPLGPAGRRSGRRSRMTSVNEFSLLVFNDFHLSLQPSEPCQLFQPSLSSNIRGVSTPG